MSSKPLSPIRKAWYRWKSLHLPWRKRFLIGLDLQGNTFWEFRDTLNSHKNRMRRIVEYPPATHYSELNISPQWHQWLRHTRRDAPSIAEQRQDLVRQQNLKVLARQADERWAAKKSFLDQPSASQPAPALTEVQNITALPQKPVSGATKSKAPRAAGWDGGIGAKGLAAGLKDAEDASTNVSEEPPATQVPALEKLGLNERPDEIATQEEKDKEDPWKQAGSASSGEWQPAAWSPNSALRR